MHDIEPWAYLRDVLTLLPVWLKSQVIELAPAYWRTTLARSEPQRLLVELSLPRRDGVHHANRTAPTNHADLTRFTDRIRNKCTCLDRHIRN